MRWRTSCESGVSGRDFFAKELALSCRGELSRSRPRELNGGHLAAFVFGLG